MKTIIVYKNKEYPIKLEKKYQDKLTVGQRVRLGIGEDTVYGVVQMRFEQKFNGDTTIYANIEPLSSTLLCLVL